MRTGRIAQSIFGAAVVAMICVALPATAGAANPWVRVAAPSPSATENTLLSVSCVSPTVCTAVGYYAVGTNSDRPLVIRTTNGTSWTRATIPATGGQVSELHDVSCTTATDCTAVGSYSIGTVNGDLKFATLVVRTTNGTSWQRVASPNPNGFSSVLWGVSCTSPVSCRAVGNAEGNSLVLRTSNGTKWFRQASPNLGAGANYLVSVSCGNNAQCTAVGFYYNKPRDTEKSRTLVMRFDGATPWQVVPSLNATPSTSDNWLDYVSCPSGFGCVAVGGVTPVSGTGKRGFVLRTIDGNSWARAATPVAGGEVELRGVSCTTVSSCTAVGIEWDALQQGFKNTILRTTNGTSWSPPSPAAHQAGRDLWAVSCPTAVKCTGVGGFSTTGSLDAPFRTLVLRES